MPQSLGALKKLDKEELQALWYAISYEQEGITIEQRHSTRLRKYARHPDMYIAKAYTHKYHLKAGSLIEKRYKGKTYRIMVCHDGQYKYNDKIYKTLSAVAKAICGKKVSGNDFFGLNNKSGGIVG